MLALGHRLLAASVLGLLLSLSITASALSQSDRLLSRIEVYVPAGLHVMTSRTSVERDGDRYAITANLQSRGLAGVFIDIASRAETKGRITERGTRPENYHAETRRNGVERRSQVAFATDGTASGGNNGMPTPIAAKDLRGTVDDLTGWFLVERQLGRGGKCDMVVPVFDGYARYNMRFSDAGEQDLSPSGGQNFAGKARVCLMKREDISGPPAGEPDSAPRSGKLWYAKLVPVEQAQVIRLELETDAGSVSGYLAEIRGTTQGRPVDVHLME